PSDAEAHAVFAISLASRGDLARAKAEFDIALRLGPSQFEILTFYIGWAVTFDDAERGAALVDEAIRLNPNYPMWSARQFAYAYYMVGRYADALRMMDRLTLDNYEEWLWTIRPGALAAVGRTEEAREAVQQALRAYPDLTIERVANWKGASDT